MKINFVDGAVNTNVLQAMSEDWVVDCLIGFLRSPGWSSPVNNFIDDNCVGETALFINRVS